MIYHLEKPIGVLSADWMRWHQSQVNARKAGHGGALDAMASGHLVMATDRDTKQLTTFLHKNKKYQCTMVLGVSTDTIDLEATQVAADTKFLQNIPPHLSEVFAQALSQWEGIHQQYVPVFSSAKVQGYTLREISRFGKIVSLVDGVVRAEYKGKTVHLELPSKEITITETAVDSFSLVTASELKTVLEGINAEVVTNSTKLDADWLHGRKSTVYGDIQRTVKQTIDDITSSCEGISAIPVVRWQATVSGGTYIRQLAVDLAAACGTIGCCLQIHRLTI